MRIILSVFLLLIACGVSHRSYALIENNLILSGSYSICNGAKSPRIVGSTPNGGSVPFSFLWIASTIDSVSGFGPANGVNDGIHHTPTTLTVSCWFRRIAISGSDADTSQAIKVSLLTHPHPKAGYIVNKAVQCFTGHSYIFTDTSTVSSGSIVNKIWDFGDVTFSTASNPVKTFAGPFNYNVKLVVTTDQGCKDSMIRTMSVLEEPKAIIACDSFEQCFNGNAFMIFNGSTITMGSITAYWSFGDGTDSTIQNIKKTYAAPGLYTVKLIAMSDYDCRDSTTRTFVVHPTPRAGFRINDPIQCLSRNEFVFTDTSSIASGMLLNRLWDFGTNDTSTASEATVSYVSAGIFNVRLIAQSAYGCTDTVAQTVSVNPGHAAGFTIDNDSQCLEGNHFVVADTSVSESRVWYWNNGDTSTARSPVISFLTAGDHQIRLVSSGSGGCDDSVTQTVVVHPKPSANIISGNSQVYTNHENVYSVPETQGSFYQWFANKGNIVAGDGSSSARVQWGSDTGTGWLKAIEISGWGCSGDTGSLNIIINSIPDSLRIGKDTIVISAASQSDTIAIYANTPWEIKVSAPWIAASATEGTGDSIVHFLFSANTGPGRSATIQVTAGATTKNVVVQQAGIVGLGEIAAIDGVSICPNPSCGLFTIENQSGLMFEAQLTDINGNRIDPPFLITTEQKYLDYSFLQSGVYILLLNHEKTAQALRLVITRQ